MLNLRDWNKFDIFAWKKSKQFKAEMNIVTFHRIMDLTEMSELHFSVKNKILGSHRSSLGYWVVEGFMSGQRVWCELTVTGQIILTKIHFDMLIIWGGTRTLFRLLISTGSHIHTETTARISLQAGWTETSEDTNLTSSCPHWLHKAHLKHIITYDL